MQADLDTYINKKNITGKSIPLSVYFNDVFVYINYSNSLNLFV